MSNINRVMLSGNLTRDPVLRSTPSGTAVLQLSMASNDRRKSAAGEWEDVPVFIDAVLFGARAEAIAGYLSKGSKVAILGKLRFTTWETNTGDKRSRLDVVVDDIEFMTPKGTESKPKPELAVDEIDPF